MAAAASTSEGVVLSKVALAGIVDESLGEVEKLDLSRRNIGFLPDLKECTKLTRFESNENKLRSLECVKNVTKISYLSFSSNLISKIDFLENLVNLKGLTVFI